jgi:hypothetical protein
MTTERKQVKVVRNDYNHKKFMELGRYQEVSSYPHPRLEGEEFVIMERAESTNDNQFDLTTYDGL